jgi:hypothetical protein
MKLLTELTDQNVECLVESVKGGGKRYFVEGIWASANTPNRNGRVYPGAVMESALGKYNSDYVSQKRALGELNHPQGPSINLDRASHIIENLKLEGNNVTGRAKIMSTPMGEIAKSLIDEGVKLGVSTRGLGSLEEGKDGYKHVKNDFFISAIDIVSDPSGPGCWIKGLLENTEWAFDADGNLVEIAKELVIDVHKKKINEEKAIKEFARFIEYLKG